MGNPQLCRYAVAFELDPDSLHIIAPEYADRRFDRRPLRHALARAVEYALHVRQEVDELGVVALLEVTGIASELVGDLAPRTVGTRRRNGIPMLMNLDCLDQRHQLQRPQQDLAKAAYRHGAVRNVLRLTGAGLARPWV